MPQVLLIAVVGAAALAGYKLVRREMARVERNLKTMREAEARAPADRGVLERGADGVYRPARRD